MARTLHAFRPRRSARFLVGAVTATMLVLLVAPAAFAATFDPTKIVSDDNMRAYDCMSQTDIQAFLNTQSGPLKSLVTNDYAGKKKPAAQIIAEACRQWHISPKVMLTLLQKEQSLLTRTTLAKNTLNRAIGAGCPDATTNKYPGFGKQMWYGARLLDGYGEGKNGSTVKLWKAPYTTYAGVNTANLATYKLYVYNPSIGAKAPYGDLSKQAANLSGNASFWWIYTKYFGNTFANPAIRTIYRFRDTKTKSYFYTASPAERYRLLKSKRFKSMSVAFRWNTAAAANSHPVYRFQNRKTGGYLFTSSESMRRGLRTKKKAKTWRYQGVAFRCSFTRTSATPVYQFNYKKTGVPFYTTSSSERNKYLTKSYRKKWASKGVPFSFAN
jgi:Repeat of unknown function (DUF5648)